MDRELKFRAYEKRMAKMYYDIAGFVFYGTNKEYVEISFCERGFTKGHIKEIKIMQFTGLKDKNGKEIYEGDICKFLNEDMGFVRMDHGWAIQYSETYSHDMPQDYCERLEIVGNIYENKDLLK